VLRRSVKRRVTISSGGPASQEGNDDGRGEMRTPDQRDANRAIQGRSWVIAVLLSFGQLCVAPPIPILSDFRRGMFVQIN